MKIFSAEQIRQWDASTIEQERISSTKLMERAAASCYNWLLNHFSRTTRFTIFCGNGNNGGDGLAIAGMLLKAGYDATIFILDSKSYSNDFSFYQDQLKSLSAKITIVNGGDLPILPKEAVVIDALFGTGLNRPLSGLAADVVRHINNAGNTVISIDIPSGLFVDSSSAGNIVIRATHTLSFQVYKLAFLLSENGKSIGRIHLLDIGLLQSYYDKTSTSFYTIDTRLVRSIYKPRDEFAHKYNFGHALLFAGSKPMMGAAILCAKACLRSGSGLVTVRTNEDTAGVLQAALPEAITNFEKDLERVMLKKAAIGIGPGLENFHDNESILQTILQEFKESIVVDATALQLLKTQLEYLKTRIGKPIVLTPHTGEFAKLFGEANNDFERMDQCMQHAKELNCYIILKGHHSMVACPDGMAYFNLNGNAGMATAGSGDVLTGILTGLLAQGLAAKDACILGVYLHGLAGNIASEKYSAEAMIASDIIESLGDAFRHIATLENSR